MKKIIRTLKAKETVDILQAGAYTVNGTTIDISNAVGEAVAGARLYAPDGFGDVLQHAGEMARSAKHATRIGVANCTVLEGAATLHAEGGRVGCLNFASAKNPGGGFLNGAVAQEESLALSSALYATQMANFGLYTFNRAQTGYLYSDHMIYSPDVPVFRDDAGELLLHPYPVSILTSPATNVGAMKANSKPEELAIVRETMLQRMDKALALFVHHGAEALLLGAWGCGVFQNDPVLIAALFAHHLTGNGKYAKCFRRVLFAVLDRREDGENVTAFRRQFAP